MHGLTKWPTLDFKVSSKSVAGEAVWSPAAWRHVHHLHHLHHFSRSTSSTCAVCCQMHFPVSALKWIPENSPAGIQSLLNADICHITRLNEATTRDKSHSALGTRLGHNERLVSLPLPEPPPPLHPWETPTLRSADKCCRCPSCLPFSLGRLGNSHASTQCLNKRVYLIQLSPQGRAKWVPVLFDRDNERAARWGEGWSSVGCFGGEEGDLGSFRRTYFSFPYMLLWTLMCLWCLGSFSVEWHVLESAIIAVQIRPNGDMERVKYKKAGHWMQRLGIFPNLAAIPLQWRACHTMQNTKEPPLFDLHSLLHSWTFIHHRAHNQPFPNSCWC